MSERRAYRLSLTVNGRRVNEVVIDPHYETKHASVLTSSRIRASLISDGKEFQPDERDGEWEFFMLDRMEHRGRQFRLIWCMRDGHPLLGVINCFRR